MPAYICHFYRDGDTAPYHVWAPYASIDDHDAEALAAHAILRARTTGNTTLSPVTRYRVHEIGVSPDLYTERTI